jgi:hypothetical protein
MMSNAPIENFKINRNNQHIEAWPIYPLELTCALLTADAFSAYTIVSRTATRGHYGSWHRHGFGVGLEDERRRFPRGTPGVSTGETFRCQPPARENRGGS